MTKLLTGIPGNVPTYMTISFVWVQYSACDFFFCAWVSFTSVFYCSLISLEITLDFEANFICSFYFYIEFFINEKVLFASRLIKFQHLQIILSRQKLLNSIYIVYLKRRKVFLVSIKVYLLSIVLPCKIAEIRAKLVVAYNLWMWFID